MTEECVSASFLSVFPSAFRFRDIMEENGKTHIKSETLSCGMLQCPERMGIDIKRMETCLFNSYAPLKLGKNIMKQEYTAPERKPILFLLVSWHIRTGRKRNGIS